MYFPVVPTSSKTKKIFKELSRAANKLNQRGVVWDYIELVGLYDDSLRLTGVTLNVKVEKKIQIEECTSDDPELDEFIEEIRQIESWNNPTAKHLRMIAENPDIKNKCNEDEIDEILFMQEGQIDCFDEEDEDYDEDDDIFDHGLNSLIHQDSASADIVESQILHPATNLASSFADALEYERRDFLSKLFHTVKKDGIDLTTQYKKTARLVYNDVDDLILDFPGFAVNISDD